MTGYLHDPSCFAKHNSPSHPENASRLDLMQAAENVQSCPVRPATNQELLAVHTAGLIQRITTLSENGGGMLDADTYCGPQSEMVARKAAGGLIDLSLGVLDGTYANGLALVRPPGHHATADRSMGFCLFNNVAVAAAALRHGGAAKVAVIDFDVHHGNGTQDIFYEDNTVLYLSSHQYPHYPGSGSPFEQGRGPGMGYTLNHPLQVGCGAEEFLAAYRDHLLLALAEFAPDFILVSAGYDAHLEDPLAGLNVTTAGFVAVTRLIVQAADDLCQGKVVFSLEGGYNPHVVAECLYETVEVLTAY